MTERNPVLFWLQNEATWKTEIEDHVQKLDKQEQKYRLLKKHVEGKLEE